MMVSANSAIWVSAEPMVAGPKRLRNVFTSVSNFGQQNRGSTPCRATSPATSRNSRMPAISTPQAAACPAVGKNAASASAIIIDRLSRIGAAAAVANRSSALRMPL